MPYKNRNHWIISLVILLPLLASQACSPGTAVIPGLPALRGSTSTPLGDAVQADLEVGPGDLFFPDPRLGLANLASYKAVLAISFDGTENGQPRSWSKTYIMLYSRKLAARLLTIAATKTTSGEPSFLAEMNGVAYEIRDGSLCLGSLLDPSNSAVQEFEPSGMLTGILGAQAAGHEVVNGLEADHYTFDERALGQAGLNRSTGEVWIATTGGYIVRYLLTAAGGAESFGEGLEGTMHWVYQLTEVDQPLVFDLPADCPQGMVDAPLLPDASDVTSLPGFTQYNTTSGLPETVAFYQSRMPAMGWTPLGEPAVTDTTAFFEYTHGDQVLSIISFTGETGNTVQIALSRSEN